MKRFSLIFSILMIMTIGCKSHKDSVVNAQPEFNPDVVWQLSDIRGKEVTFLDGQKKINIQINTEAGTFSGNSGCNRYFGTFKDLGNGKMTLSGFNGTKMACPEAFHKIENNYLQLLRRCDGYRLSEYTLELLQDDKVLLTFEKTVEGDK